MGINGKRLRRAVFLDRDGVLNAALIRDGRPYPPPTVAEVHILSDVPAALQLLKDAGLALAMVTNQPDVARGTQRREVVEAINSWLQSQLPLDWVEVCFHDENDNCDCRKPKPGLIVRSARAIGVDISSGFMVGDRWRDIEAGKAAGCRTIWIDRGYREKKPENYDYRCQSLLEAAQWVVQQCA